MARKLIPKLLRDHEATDAAVHDADTDPAELWMQNISAMAGGVQLRRPGEGGCGTGSAACGRWLWNRVFVQYKSLKSRMKLGTMRRVGSDD